MEATTAMATQAIRKYENAAWACMIDLQRMVAARAAQRAEFSGETCDFVVQVKDGDKSRAATDGQQ